MSVELTPRGTHGWEMPHIPVWITRALLGLTLIAHRLLGDRMRIWGQPLVLLTTIGAKTGQRRQTLVCRFPEGDNWLVIASFAGSAQHPAWYVNMAKNPDKVWIEIRRQTAKVRPESLKGMEREEALGRILAAAPGYAGYQAKTDREIPIVRLTPTSA